jgi:uncharacterized protein
VTPDPEAVTVLASPEVREAALIARLRALPSLIVAYSGGVDSAYLAWAASRAMGARLLCVTADSPSYPERHRAMAIDIATRFSLPHEIIRTSEMDRPEYTANPVNRCYFCKHELYTSLSALASSRGFAAIADGNNADDRADYRPGRAAAREFSVISPLDEVDLTKAEIRALSHAAGLPTWDEPASACLSSRIPYQSEVTEAKLRAIERAEEALRGMGFRVVRVRHLGASATVELGGEELARAGQPDAALAIADAVRACGFDVVTIDPRGYRRGSLNEGLTLRAI